MESTITDLEFDKEVNVDVAVSALHNNLTSIIAAANRIDDCTSILAGMKQVLAEATKKEESKFENPPELTQTQISGQEGKESLTDG